MARMIHVVLASAHPSQLDAVAALAQEGDELPGPYLGVWTMPLPYGGRVHVFADIAAEQLEAAGWTREQA